MTVLPFSSPKCRKLHKKKGVKGRKRRRRLCSNVTKALLEFVRVSSRGKGTRRRKRRRQGSQSLLQVETEREHRSLNIRILFSCCRYGFIAKLMVCQEKAKHPDTFSARELVRFAVRCLTFLFFFPSEKQQQQQQQHSPDSQRDGEARGGVV